MPTKFILYPSTKSGIAYEAKRLVKAYLKGEVGNEELAFVVSSWRYTCPVLFWDEEQNKLADCFVRHVGKRKARVVLSALQAHELAINTAPAV